MNMFSCFGFSIPLKVIVNNFLRDYPPPPHYQPQYSRPYVPIERIIQKYPGTIDHWEKAKVYLELDPPNSAEEAMKALESMTRTIYGDNKDFPMIVKEWANKGKIPKLLSEIFVKLYGYRGDKLAHGKIEPLKVEGEETDYFLNECANAIVYLDKKYMMGENV
jgi:hypothetical protein